MSYRWLDRRVSGLPTLKAIPTGRLDYNGRNHYINERALPMTGVLILHRIAEFQLSLPDKSMGI